jgi:hypothetical protein
MFHQDYTRKTQETAEQARQKAAEFAQREQEFQLRTQAQLQLVGEYARLAALDQQLETYSKVNWQLASAQDPAAAQAAWMQYQQLKDQRGQTFTRLQEAEARSVASQRQALAQRFEEASRRLPQEINGWGPELRDKVKSATMNNYGFTEAEMLLVTDARLVKLMHDAYQHRVLLANASAQGSQQGTTQQQSNQQPPAGLPVVGLRPTAQLPGSGSGGAKPITDPSIPLDDWMRRRTEQVRKRGARPRA